MAENTPESELGSIECFQNYTAPEVFIQGLAGIVNQQDVESMIRAQKQMLQRFEKTNEMLSNCNSLSINRLKVANSEFKKHTHLLTDMRKDLDNIFKRINILKSKLNSQYPQAFTAERVQNSSFCKEDKVNTFSNEVNTGKSAPSKSYGLATGINNTEKNDNIRFKDSASTGEQGVEEDDNCFTPHNPDDRKTMKRANSSSSDSNNGNSNNDSSPYTSDTG